jgi:electron transfer flavoprotein beta subunit
MAVQREVVLTNIVVAVKHVVATADGTSFEPDLTLQRAGRDGLLSELDEYAVEQALRLKDSLTDGIVTVLTVGPAAAEEALRKALQMGADEGVHVEDDALGGSDALSTSLVLAEAIDRLPHDIVVFGMSSTDAWMGVLPTMVSERLGVPVLARAAEMSLKGSTLRIRREDDGAVQVAEADLPVLVSVTDRSGEPRYPSFKGIMAAKKKPVNKWTLADIGIAPCDVGAGGAAVVLESVSPRPPRSQGVLVVDEDGSGAEQLFDFLSVNKFV